MKMWMHKMLKMMGARIVSARGTYRLTNNSSAGTICNRKSTTYKRETKIAPKNCAAVPVGGGMGIKCRNPFSPNVRKIKPNRQRAIVETIFIVFSSCRKSPAGVVLTAGLY